MWPAWEQLLVTRSDVKFWSGDFPGSWQWPPLPNQPRPRARPIQEPQAGEHSHWVLRPT